MKLNNLSKTKIFIFCFIIYLGIGAFCFTVFPGFSIFKTEEEIKADIIKDYRRKDALTNPSGDEICSAFRAWEKKYHTIEPNMDHTCYIHELHDHIE